MSLEFKIPTRAKLKHVNLRDENHGEEHIPAMDLRFELEAPNTVLECFHPDLRGYLFMPSYQGQLEGVEQVAEATELRFPNMISPIKWDEELHGYSLTVHLDTGDASPLRLTDCRVHRQVIVPKRGGTCCVSFTSSGTEMLTADLIGALGVHVQREVKIELVKPTPTSEAG